MKYKTFEALLNNCNKLYKDAVEQDYKIQDAFGGDTQVMTDWWDASITETLNIISNDMGDTSEAVDWLFWESMQNDDYMDFEINGITYEGSPRNIWLDLKGKLDERYSKPKELKEDEIKEVDETEFNWNDMSTFHRTNDIQDYRKRYSEIREDMVKEFSEVLKEFMFEHSTEETLHRIADAFSKVCEKFKASGVLRDYSMSTNDKKLDMNFKYDSTIMVDEVFLSMSDDGVTLGEYNQ
jgi:hypothetical protein